MADAKRVGDSCVKDGVPMNESTGCGYAAACKGTRESFCFDQLAFELVVLFLAYALYGAEAFVRCISRDCINAFSCIISFVFDVDIPRLVIGCENRSSGAGENCTDYLSI